MGWGSLVGCSVRTARSARDSLDFTLLLEVTRLTREAKEMRHGTAKLFYTGPAGRPWLWLWDSGVMTKFIIRNVRVKICSIFSWT